VAAKFDLLIPYSTEGVPHALPLLPGGGTITGRDGRAYKHGNPLKTLQALEHSFKDFPMILDENHSLERAPPGAPTPALCRMKGFALRSDGSIWATDLQWTPYGKERIKQGAYIGVSPTILFDRTTAGEQDGSSIDGDIVSIENAGLVNSPNFVMPALHSKDLKMNPEEIKAAVAEAAKTAIQDAVKVATESMLAAFVPVREAIDAKVADLSTQFNALKEAVAKPAVDAAIATHAQRVEQVVSRAVTAGKIAPVSKAYHMKQLKTPEDVTEFETHFETAAPVIENDKLETGRSTHAKGGAVDPVAEKLARSMGLKVSDLQ
jgi:hypothetical protein